MGTSCRCATRCRYLDRAPERLVVEGLRRWMMGGEAGSIANWSRAAEFFVDELGAVDGRRLFLAFVRWLDTLDAFMDRPAMTSPIECPRLCRDECMALAMIAAAQYADCDGVMTASSRLVSPEGLAPAVEASSCFAAALAGAGHHLMPVPAAVVREIADRPARRAFH
jgi:hypothetical protein